MKILETTVDKTRKDLAIKLDDALWAYRTAYKMPIGITPFNLLYGKNCHLPVKMEHKALWAVKLFIKMASEKRLIQLEELEEICHVAYESSRIYKEKTKSFHDKKILKREFKVGYQVLLFNWRLRLFLGKLKSKSTGPYEIKDVRPYGAIFLVGKDGMEFTVNGEQCKSYLANEVVGEGVKISLSDPPQA